MAASSDFTVRMAAVRLLANHFGDPRARTQLVLALDDSDTAVAAAVTEVLVRAGGIAGLRDALHHFVVGDEDTGYYIRGTLVGMLLDGHPIREMVREILREEPPGATREGALEMLSVLRG